MFLPTIVKHAETAVVKKKTSIPGGFNNKAKVSAEFTAINGV